VKELMVAYNYCSWWYFDAMVDETVLDAPPEQIDALLQPLVPRGKVSWHGPVCIEANL
jgi:hypothetical protein